MELQELAVEHEGWKEHDVAGTDVEPKEWVGFCNKFLMMVVAVVAGGGRKARYSKKKRRKARGCHLPGLTATCRGRWKFPE